MATVVPLKWRKRGASMASWRSMPKSMRLSSTWTWPWGCIEPPMTPKDSQGLPSLVTNAGMMVWKGRLFGPIRSGLSAPPC